MEYTVLNNEVKCPVVGIGTFMLSPEEAENSVREALKMGYSLVNYPVRTLRTSLFWRGF